jgi:hypothetical protein
MTDSQPCPTNNPEDRIPKVSALCSYGMRPHVTTGLLRQLLIGHFADAENIAEPVLRQKFEETGAWVKDENGINNSGILIESITRWLPNEADNRPAILIKRNGWTWQKTGIGDKAGFDLTSGASKYHGLWQGSHTLYCLAVNGLEAELLAVEVIKFLQHFGPWIREQMGFMRFFVSEVGGVAEVQEVVEGYAVPITVAYVAEEAWELQPAVPRLKRITLKASELFAC